MPYGAVSCDETEVALTKTAVEASKVPSIRLLDVSCTAPGSIVSSGVVSPATVARCDRVRVKEIVASSSEVVPNSPALKVMPPV